MVEFSIIVPTYGRERFLHEALLSLLYQTFEDFECIVVDDASPEPVRLPDLDRRFRLVRLDRNRGASGARQEGVRRATGQAILFLDDDDRFTPYRLDLARKGLALAPIACCLSSRESRELNGDVCGRILDGPVPHLGATAVDRSIVAPFDPSYVACEDIEWWLRQSFRGHVATVSEVGYVVGQHDGQRVGYGVQARIDASHRLLREYPIYFRERPRAAAFRWYRIGLMELSLGRRRAAAGAFLKSMQLDPTVKAGVQTVRSLLGA